MQKNVITYNFQGNYFDATHLTYLRHEDWEVLILCYPPFVLAARWVEIPITP